MLLGFWCELYGAFTRGSPMLGFNYSRKGGNVLIAYKPNAADQTKVDSWPGAEG